MTPAVIDTAGEGDVDKGPPLRALWFAEKLHPGLMWETVSLAGIARNAGTDDVFPGSLSAAVPG